MKSKKKELVAVETPRLPRRIPVNTKKPSKPLSELRETKAFSPLGEGGQVAQNGNEAFGAEFSY